MRALRLLLAITLLGTVGAVGSAEASTIVYQCGAAICALDPDAPGATPRTVTAEGRLAGLTRDGATVSWVPPSRGLVQAPLQGGAPRSVFGGSVVNQPSMSPDGSKYLWWYPGPDGLGGLNAVWVNRFTVGQPGSEVITSCAYCVTSHGWLNETPIAAFPATTGGVPSRICRLATAKEDPGSTGNCKQVLASDARGGIAFPSGNAAGTEIVAALSLGERTGVQGRIVRYSVASGAPLGDVTEGTDDTTPVFSPEDDRVAFDRAEQIVVKDLATGAERTLGPGVYPFWGGARTAVATIASRTLRYREGRIRVTVRCAAGEPCRGTLRIAKAKTTLGSRAYRVAAGRSASVSIKPSRRGHRTIARSRTHKVTVQLKPSTGAATSRKLTLRR